MSLIQSDNSRISPISGIVSRAHCTAASLATRAQRSSLLLARKLPGRAIVLSEISGIILSTPNSVAFSTTKSNLFCLGKHSASVMCFVKISASSDSSFIICTVSALTFVISLTHFALILSLSKFVSSIIAVLPAASTATILSPFLARNEYAKCRASLPVIVTLSEMISSKKIRFI